MNKKQFLIVSAVFPPEPVVSAQLSFDLATAVAQKDEVVVVSPEPTRPFGFKFVNNGLRAKFQHHILKSYTCPQSNIFGRLWETFSFGKECQKFISKNHNSISQVYSNTWPLFAQYYTVKTARKFGIPVTVHVQDIYPESLSNKIPVLGGLVQMILFPLDKFVLRNATHIIAISEKMKVYLAASRMIDPAKISVVHNWQDEESFISYNSSNNGAKALSHPFTFMYLGNLGPVAGIELLIEAFAKAGLSHCRLVIAGAGSMKESLMKLASGYPEAKIEFWSVPDGKVQEIQDLADVMLLPMKKGAASSSVPSKLPAYMFSKKPVIACVDEESDTGITIKKGNCGWVLPPENSLILSEYMKEVSKSSEDDLKNKGESGYSYAIEKFSKKSNLQKLLNIVNANLG